LQYSVFKNKGFLGNIAQIVDYKINLLDLNQVHLSVIFWSGMTYEQNKIQQKKINLQ